MRSLLVYLPFGLHVAPGINSRASSPKRDRRAGGEGGHSNKPITSVTQTKALDRERMKDS